MIIHTILIDDHPVVRAGIRSILRRFDDIQIIAEASNGPDGVRCGANQHVDVALIDLVMPGMDGMEVAASMRKVSPRTKNIIVTGAVGPEPISHPLPATVDGLFQKGRNVEYLALMIRRVNQGERCVPEPENGATGGMEALTLREREMLLEIAKGASVKQAARRMGVTYKAADNVKQSLMDKLQIHDRVELARFAIREHLASPAL